MKKTCKRHLQVKGWEMVFFLQFPKGNSNVLTKNSTYSMITSNSLQTGPKVERIEVHF